MIAQDTVLHVAAHAKLIPKSVIATTTPATPAAPSGIRPKQPAITKCNLSTSPAIMWDCSSHQRIRVVQRSPLLMTNKKHITM
jgi:hypothetical protein